VIIEKTGWTGKWVKKCGQERGANKTIRFQERAGAPVLCSKRPEWRQRILISRGSVVEKKNRRFASKCFNDKIVYKVEGGNSGKADFGQRNSCGGVKGSGQKPVWTNINEYSNLSRAFWKNQRSP